MGSGLISIAMTGIQAAQTGLLTTGNNITNAHSDGYSRQRVVQASNTSIWSGAGSIGQGTHVVTVARMYSETLTKQVLNAQTSVSSLDSYYSEISQIDNLLADSEAGLTPLIQSFFEGIQSVASNPSNYSARQSMVSSAETMVAGFQEMYSRFSELESGVNDQITSTVNSINTYSSQIADLNKRIMASGDQPANDLLDQRDLMVSELNKLVKVSVAAEDDGSYSVSIGTGQSLVVGTQVSKLAAVPSSADASRTVVGLMGVTGNVMELPEKLISGGQLGGLLSFRTDALDASFNKLGQLASSVALAFNAQNALGQDQLGNIAGDSSFVADFFQIASPSVISNGNNSASSPVVSASFDDASYNGTNFYTNLTASDYKLAYDGSAFKLTRLSDNQSWTGSSIDDINAALSSDPQGFSLSTAAGSFAAGDSYLIQPTRDLARGFTVNTSVSADPNLVAAALPVRASTAAANTGSMSLSSISVGPDYSANGLPLSLTYNGGNLSGFPTGTVTVTSGGATTSYTITAATDTIPYTSGATLTLSGSNTASDPSGISLTLAGVPADGDSISLQRNTSGVEDGGNVVRLGKLQTQNTMEGGTATFEDDYAAFVNDIGNKTNAASIASDSQSVLLSQAQAAQESLSGVNTEEEAAKLIEYQQAFQAAAKILDAASKVFDTLLSIGA